MLPRTFIRITIICKICQNVAAAMMQLAYVRNKSQRPVRSIGTKYLSRQHQYSVSLREARVRTLTDPHAGSFPDNVTNVFSVSAVAVLDTWN